MKRIVSARAKLKKAMSAFLASAVIGGSMFGIGQVIACGPFSKRRFFTMSCIRIFLSNSLPEATSAYYNLTMPDPTWWWHIDT